MNKHSSETNVEPRFSDIHRMEITRKIGWYHWAVCSCGWVCCNPDRREVDNEARLHTLKERGGIYNG